MAGIYCADVYCDDCINDIKDKICEELWDNRNSAECPDGTPCSEFENGQELADYLDSMNEGHYDSGEYPKHCDDDEESDTPEHCGSHEDCLNYGELSDGSKYGYFFGNTLTTDGGNYVIEAVRDGEEGGVAREVWAVEYDYLDFEEEDDYDD